MDKNEYIALREQEEIPVLLFYEYYKEMGGNQTSEDFTKFFEIFIGQVNNKIVQTFTSRRFIEIGKIYSKVCEHFNKKFSC